MTANREQKKLSTIDKTEEFEQRKERSKIYLYKILFQVIFLLFRTD